jgi:hypothetical protein
MTTMIRLTGGLAVALTLLGCSKDAQTEGEVRTEEAGGLASTSISGDSADKRGQALVRVVNAVPTSGSLTIRSDETHTLPAVEYGRVSPYQPIDRNWVTFQISGSPAGTYEPLETNREMLTDGHRYTIVVMRDKDATEYETRILRDEISSDMSRAHLRVIHAATGTDEVNVVARGGETLFDGVNFSSEAGFKDVMPWMGTLEFRAEDGNRLLFSLPKVDLRAGKSYTVVLSRDKAGKLDAFLFEDEQV